MYAINQCCDLRDFVSPRYKAIKVSVLSSKSIFSIDAVTSDVDVHDTLLLIKRNTITTILEHFHKFDRKIRSTFDLFEIIFDLFENSTPHFLDKNMHSRTKKALYINIFAIVIISNTYKIYTTYPIFLLMRTLHLLL